MTPQKEHSFDGFSKATILFLRKLRDNNNSAWFNAHKDDYTEYVLEPLKALVADLGYFMLGIDPMLIVTPAVSKTISRPNRDTRYSNDKSPYRTAMWMSFKRSKNEWQTAPAYFFEISINSYRYGMGFYSASTSTMKTFRDMIDKNPAEFEKAVSFFKKQDMLTLEGDDYKRIIDASKPEEIQKWYQKKSFYLECKRKVDDSLFNPRLVDDIIDAYKRTIPLYNYLWKVIARQMAEKAQALNDHGEKWPHREY